MLKCFPDMIRNGTELVYQFFQSNTYQPHLMQQPMTVPWPSGLEEHIFASHTAMIGPKILYQALKQRVEKEAEELAQDNKMLPVMSLKSMIENEITKAEEIKSKRSHLREQILVDDQENRQVARRVKIESVDMDWVFNEDNAENLLVLLSRKAKSKLYV